MTGYPPIVRRYWARLLWLPLVLMVAAVAALVGQGIPDARPASPADTNKAGVVADLLERRGEGRFSVRYEHPVTKQVIVTDLQVVLPSLRRSVTEKVNLVVDRGDPLRIELEGDRLPWEGQFAANLTLVGLGLVVVVVRRMGVARTGRLLSRELTFSMLGAISHTVTGKLILHLYSLDSKPGSQPLCSIPILTTGQAPIGDVAFVVAVKGEPRPFGRVVARVNEQVLWPRGRARRLQDHPRPERVEEVAGLQILDPRQLPTLPVPRWTRSGLATPLYVVASMIFFTVLVASVVRLNAASDRRDRDQSIRANAVLVEQQDGVVSLRVESRAGSRVVWAPIDVNSTYRVGIAYPVYLDARHPDRALLAAEPYNAVPPVLTPLLALGASCLLGASSLARIRRCLLLARVGPWSRALLVRPADAARGAHLVNECGQRIGGVNINTRQFGANGRVEVIVAGPAQPGDQLVLWLETRPDENFLGQMTTSVTKPLPIRWRIYTVLGRRQSGRPGSDHPS